MELPTDILYSEDFKANLSKEVEHIKITYHKVALKEGQAWKRTPIDYLLENGLLDVDKLISEFEIITRKQSKLASGVREYVKIFIYQAIQTTLEGRQRKIEQEYNKDGKEK